MAVPVIGGPKPPRQSPVMPSMPRLPRGPRFGSYPGMPKFPKLRPLMPEEAGNLTGTNNQAPPVPEWFSSEYPTGSDLEWFVYWWLTANNVPFTYLYQYKGGRSAPFYAGQEFDFLVTDRYPGLVLDVHGEYWHYSNTQSRQKERARKRLIQSKGFQVVFLREQDLRQSLKGTMQEAMRGIQTFPDPS